MSEALVISHETTEQPVCDVKIPSKLSFEELKEVLAKLLDGDTADIDKIRAALEAYTSDPQDWEEFAHWNDHTYTRNLIDEGNAKYNLILLCWNNGQASSIHDHAGSHCFMKCLDGTLSEELYSCPDEVEVGKELKPRKVSELKTDGVCYISDKVGMHRISNPSHTIPSVSLHLYSPPYQMCRSYREQDGEAKCSGPISFYSVHGVKTCNDDLQPNPLGEGASLFANSSK